MNARSVRRSIVILAAVGAVAAAVGVLFRGNLQLTYYEYRLRLQPEYLLTLLTEPEGSPAHAAATRSLEQRPARAVLFEAFVTHLAEEIERADVAAGRAFTSFGGGRVWFDASYSGRKLEAGEVFCAQHEVVGAIKPLLPRLEGDVFQFAGARGFEFSILTRDEAVRLYRQSIPDTEIGSIFTFQGGDPHVCRVRKVTSGTESARAESRG